MTEPTSTDIPARHPLPAALIHDLRTPLNQIIGYSELVMEELAGAAAEDTVAHLAKVRAAGYCLLALIEESFLAVRTSADGEVRTRSEASATEAGFEPLPIDAAAIAPEWTVGDARILVVDDVATNRDLLSRRLEHDGYRVTTAEGGARALAMLQADPFDLVLLDIMMPEMDGHEVLRRIREHDRLGDLPVIMVSAVDQVDSVARCLESGADDYLTKPFNPVLLRARIRAALVRKRARDREKQLLDQLRASLDQLEAAGGAVDPRRARSST